MFKDRGTKKWTAMMLPEHVQSIRNIWEQDKKVEKPIVDEQQLDMLNLIIKRALFHKQYVRITYYENGSYKKISGYITKVDALASQLSLQTTKRRNVNISIHQILEAEPILPFFHKEE